VVSLALGIVFISQSVIKNHELKTMAQAENVTLGLSDEQVENGEVVDSLNELLAAGDILREHRQGIAMTYGDLLGGGRFDPTNPKHLTYAQAINLENYLYVGALSFGLTQEILASGVFMIVMAIALGATGIALLQLARK